jgi:hypothetical protein
MDDDAPPRMLCGRCRRPLDWQPYYEGGQRVGFAYSHPAIALPEDHAPEPIPEEGPVSAVTACDFCAAPGPSWEYPARPFTTTDVLQVTPGGELDAVFSSVIYRSDDAWGACERCHDDIEAGRWNRVTYRALRRHRASLRAELEPTMRALWAVFEEHRSGPPRRR